MRYPPAPGFMKRVPLALALVVVVVWPSRAAVPAPTAQMPTAETPTARTPGAQAPTASSSLPLPVAVAADVGMSDDALAQIAPAMRRWVDRQRAAGIVTLVARRGRVVHWEAAGYRDLEGRDPLERDDIFRIYSMTKPVTAVAVMMLVEEGKVALDDPVSRYLPAFADVEVLAEGERVAPSRPITVEDLLRHTGGLAYGLGLDPGPVDTLYAQADLFSRDLAGFVEAASALPLAAQPGERWIYSISSDVLGRLVEVVAGHPFDAFLAGRIFAPLKMLDTGFFVSGGKTDRLTALYSLGEGGTLVEIPSPLGVEGARRPTLLSGGGGLVSTAGDYVRFAQMLLNGGELEGTRLLRTETVELMRRNGLADELIPIGFGPQRLAGYGFGLGFGVLVDEDATPVPDNDGVFRWMGIASTYFWIDPEAELVALVMAQVFPPSLGTLEAEFQTLVYDALRD